MCRSRQSSKLVRRVTDDDVELHVASEQLGDPSLDVVGVDERVGVRLEARATVEGLLARSAVLAPAVRELLDLVAVLVGVSTHSSPDPGVLRPLEPDVAASASERLGDRVRAVRVLRAVDAPAGQRLVRWVMPMP